MAKSDKETTKASAADTKSKSGLYVIGGLIAAALVVGLFFFSGETPADPNKPKADPQLAALLEEGPLEDIVMGDPNAETVIVEYASMTCPHCAYFYAEVFPQLKEKYIDTGKVRFIFREFPLDALAARASMLARCVDKDRFHPIVDGLFETQETWAAPGPDGEENLKRIAKQAGFSEESYKQCIEDKELFEKIVAVRKKAHEEYGVDSTPAFFVNGKRLDGVAFEVFEAAIEGKSETAPAG
ncbi:MAG: DsbA family protein [Pseudomonadota bacterium]